MNTIQRNHPKTNREVGAAHKFADGLNRHANSEVPSIASRSIHDQPTETISLSEQLLVEWNHRLKNNLQILVGLARPATRKLARYCRMQSDASGQSEPRNGPTIARVAQPT